MDFKEGEIKGVIIEKLNKFYDERGFLLETFRIDKLPDKLRPAMSYISYTKPGIARGPHEHNKQTDIFCFMGPGNFRIKLWDNRRESRTCLLYTSDAADEEDSVDLGGRRIIKKK